MTATLRTEFRKLVTTRIWWVLLAAMAAYMVFLGATMAFSFTVDGGTTTSVTGSTTTTQLDPLDIARTVYTLAPALAYVFPVIVGVLSITGEVRHKTTTLTYLVEPRRGRVLVAKLVASLPVGVLFGLAGTAATVLAGATVLGIRGDATMLGEPTVWRAIGLSVLAMTVWCMVGVGFGAVLPNQVAAIVVLLAFTQFVEPLVRIGLVAVHAPGVAQWLPGAAGEAITGASLYTSLAGGQMLPWWQGLLVLVGYGLLLAGIGRVTTVRRDVT
ncbi:ABC transporter permease [Isoptericola sp. b441]|uniref:ABC transporter permease n=1 Tax=Actinotalea lenta TaxID=3064654 RepID=A0ABT9DFD2_9CELL|nr:MULTISPECIES: ABC transporter permease subunit [unclassified Isoptericola]MDO8108612.1 ABC transporter permease [Isoptericola sp. b441]MDO8120022.1 ABC transporter permease [Isoptericola sp. b490]